MPVPAGVVVLCQQGNLSPQGRTHVKENCRFALDLSNTSVPSMDVVAAAPGRVAHAYSGSSPDDHHAGLGFGNQVKVEHGDGYFTMYAHLDRVLVKAGDFVDSGAAIGTIGFTGAAGNRHLHFSLHQGTPDLLGVYESIAMDALVTADVSAAGSEPPVRFAATSSMGLADGRHDAWAGALYASENRPGTPPLSGPPPADLAAILSLSRARLAQHVADRALLDTIARDWHLHEPGWPAASLAPILTRDPQNPVARYWLATAVHMPAQRWDDAGTTLRDVLASGPGEPTWESWLPAWIHNRLGQLALRKGDVAAARAHFTEALERSTAQPERVFAATQLRLL